MNCSNSKEFLEIVDAIKAEKVCLWIGSGMSLEAGYPSAHRLGELLKTEVGGGGECSSYFSDSDGLDVIADTFVKLHPEGRSALNKILIREFSKEGRNSHFHDLLVRIPYFKSIITTNYDSLIEDAYSDKRCLTIRKPHDFMNGSSSITKVFKIHGCLQSLNDIVITKSDYERLYRKPNKSILDTLDSEIIRYQYHLFIGYGFNDGNIRAEFDYIQNYILSNSSKKLKLYHISPSDLTLKQDLDFVDRKIYHFTATGVSFMEEVVSKLKSTINSDLEQGTINVMDVKKFVENFDLTVKFDDRLTSIITIEAMNRDLEHKLNFEAKSGFVSDMKSFIEGDGRFEFMIDRNLIQNVNYNIEGFSLLNMDNFSRLLMQRAPSKQGTAYLYFPQRDFRIDFDAFTLYSWGHGNFKIIFSKGVFDVQIINGDQGGAKFKFNQPRGITNVTDGAHFYKAVYLCVSGELFNIVLDSGESLVSRRLAIEKAVQWAHTRFLFYSGLLKIENHSLKTFGGFNESEVTDQVYYDVLKLVSLIDKGYFDQREKAMELKELGVCSIRDKVKFNTVMEQFTLVLKTTTNHVFSILGLEFTFENKVLLVPRPCFFEENGVLTLKSDDGVVRYTFKDCDFYKKVPKLGEIWHK